MDETTLARAIEQFFSTKGFGKGRGSGFRWCMALPRSWGARCDQEQARSRDERRALAAAEPRQDGPFGSGTRRRACFGARHGPARRRRGGGAHKHCRDACRARLRRDRGRLGRGGASPDRERRAGPACDHRSSNARHDGTDLAHAMHGYADVEGVAPDLPRLTKPFRKDELAASLAGLPSSALG